METANYTLHKIDNIEAIPFGLLLLADETKAAIEKYIYQSDTYTLFIKSSSDPIGVFALYRLHDTTIEIKNIAVTESFRGNGIGSFMIERIKEIAREKGFKEIIVGTPDLASREIAFYESNGFVKYDIRTNFFTDNYPDPIIENGVVLQNMVVLKFCFDL